MPSVLDNLTYLFQRYVVPRQVALLHILRSVLVIFVVAVLLETFLFNINFFLSATYETANLNDQLTLRLNDDGAYQLTESDHVIEIQNLDTQVHNIHLDFDSSQPAQVVTLKIQFTDEAHHTYFDSTEYTVGVPDVDVSTKCWQSEYINLNTSGNVGSLRIEVVEDDTSYPIYLNRLEINAHHPFDFNVGRFFIAFGVLLLCWMFRPNSSMYKIGIVEHPRQSKAAIIAAVCIQACLISAYLFMGSNLVGVASSSYNSGSWDGVSIVNTYEVGGANAQQYAELAKAMAHGQLYLDEEPPEWLQSMDDPYDKGARDELQKQTGEEYLFDVAYHDGHYYVYFGVVPVLIFYLPFYLLTGANFPTAIGVLIAVLAYLLGVTALLDRFARYHFKNVSLGLYLLLQIPLVVCSGTLYLLKFPTFYSLPIALALAFSVWGLYFWMHGRTAKRPEGWFLAGSLCMALVVGCRPQFIVLSLVAIPLFWRTYISKKRIITPSGMREFACLIAPYIVVAAGIMAYNYARFGSLTDFGANYNLTVNDMTKRGWNIGRLAPALFSYFLQTPNLTGVFPFIQPVNFDTTYIGQTIKEVTFGGVLACLPILWILPFGRRILKLRIQQRSTRTIAGVIIALLSGAVIIALADAEMAGILQRYFADFSFMLLASVILLVFIVNENMSEHPRVQNILMRVLLTLVTLSVVYSVLVCFVPETGWFSDVYDWAYQDIIEAFEFWT